MVYWLYTGALPLLFAKLTGKHLPYNDHVHSNVICSIEINVFLSIYLVKFNNFF